MKMDSQGRVSWHYVSGTALQDLVIDFALAQKPHKSLKEASKNLDDHIPY